MNPGEDWCLRCSGLTGSEYEVSLHSGKLVKLDACLAFREYVFGIGCLVAFMMSETKRIVCSLSFSELLVRDKGSLLSSPVCGGPIAGMV